MNVDSLEISIQSTVDDVNRSLDSLIGKLSLVAKGISEITKNNGLADFAKKSESVSKGVNSAQKNVEVFAKAASTQMQGISKNAEQLAEQFKDLGKGFEFKGSDVAIQKQIDKYSNKLQEAKLRQQELEATGTVDTKEYETAIMKVQEFSNIIESLRSQIKTSMVPHVDLSSLNKEEFNKWFESLEGIKAQAEQAAQSASRSLSSIEIPKISLVPLESLNYNAEAMKAVFGEAAANIQNYQQAVAKFGTSAAEILNKGIEPKTDLSQMSAKELDEWFDNLPSVKERVEQAAKAIDNSLKQIEKPRKVTVSTESLNYNAEAMKAVFGEAAANIQNYQQAVAKFGQQAGEALNKSASGFSSGGIKERTREFAEALENLKVPKIDETNLEKLRISLSKTESDLENLRIKLENGITMGRINESVDDSGYRKLQEQIAMSEKTADALREKMRELGGSSGQVGVLRATFDGLKMAIHAPISALKLLSGYLLELPSKGIELITDSLKKLGDIAKSTAKMIGGMYLGALKSASEKALQFTKSLIGLHGASKKSNSAFNGGFKTLLKYGLGIRSVYTLMNKLRNAIKDGYGNLVQYSDETNRSISSMTSALLTLKNALAAAFNPIVNVVAPYLSAFINMLATAANKVGQFFAALTGKSVAVQAKQVYQDYAASLDDTADSTKKASKAQEDYNDNLQGFDRLNVVNKEKEDKDSGKTGSSGKTGGLVPADMFETLPIENGISDFAKKVKEAWEKADFTEIGSIIGSKLKNALDNIKWDEIKAKARKLAKSLATLINGFVEVEGLGESIGKTLAEWINTKIGAIEELGENLHFDKIGDFIADGINGMLSNIEWDTALSAAKLWGEGLADLLNHALTQEVFENIGRTIGMGLNTALTFANGFLEKFDWKTFGANIAYGLAAAIEAIDWELFGTTIANSFNALFGMIAGFAETFPWSEFGTKVATGVNKAITTFRWGDAGAGVGKFVSGLFETLKAFIDETDWKALGSGITTSISSFLGNINWGAVGGTISSFAIGVYNFLSGLISGVDWGGIPQGIINSISDFFNGFDYDGVFGSFGEFIGTAIAAGIDLLSALGDVLSGAWDGVVEYFSGYIEDSGGDIIQGLWNGIVDAVKGVGKWIQEHIFDPFIKGFKKAFGIASPSKVMKEMGGYIIDGLKNGISSTIGKVVEFFEKLWKNIKEVFANVKTWFGDKFKSAYEAVKTEFSNIGTWFGDRWTDIKNVFENVKSWFSEKFESAYSAVKSVFKNIGTWFGNRWTDIKNAFSSVKTWFGEKFANAYEAVKSAFKNIGTWFGNRWTDVKNALSNVKDWFGKKFENAYNAVKTAFKGIGTWFGNRWTDVKNVFTGGKTTVKSFFSDAFQKAYDAVTKIWDNIGGYFEGIFKTVLKPIKNIINGVIDGVNWVLKKVGSGTHLDRWNPEGFAKGSSGIPKDTFGIVNDQKGATYRELIVPPHGKPFIPKGRNVMLPLEKGTKIMPAMETKRFISGLPHFEGGIGDFIGGAWEKVKNFTGQIWDYISEPKKIVQIAIDKFTNMTGVLEPMLSIAKGAVSTIADGATSFVKKVFDEELKVDYKVGAGVQQWAGLAAKALQITGQYSAANLSYLLQQMQHESGGNPNAINLWDSNAKKGTPSKGLMQVIDPTFRANAKAPYNKNIYDPLSNMIAAINYTVKRYGSLYKGWAARGFKGYAEGIGKITLSDVIPGYANGGFPASGQLFLARENGTPEMVGKIGSRTAVTNNEQITDAVAKALSQKLSDTSKEFEDIMNKLAKSIKKSFEDAEQESGVDQKSINEAAGKVSGELQKTLSAVETQFSKTGEVSRSEMQSLLSKTKEIIEQTKAQSTENAAALSSIYQDISTMASSAFDKLELAAQSYNSYAKKAVQETEYKASVELEIDSGMDDEAYEAGQNAVSSFSDGMSSYISDMENWVNEMRDSAANGFSGIADQMQIYGNDAMDGYDYGIYSGYDDLADTVYNAASGVSDGFSGIEADVIIDGSNVITGLQEGMASQWETLTEWLNERKEELTASLYEIGDYMKPIGERIVSELLAGIESLWSSVEEWSGKIKEAFSSAQAIAAKLEQEQTKVSAKSAKSKVSETAKSLKTSTKQYKEADLVKTAEFSKYQQTATSKEYNKYSTQAGNDIKNQNARDMSVSMISAMNQVLVPALQKIGNTTVELKGDAKGMFDAVVKENNKFKTITGASALR